MIIDFEKSRKEIEKYATHPEGKEIATSIALLVLAKSVHQLAKAVYLNSNHSSRDKRDNFEKEIGITQ